MSNSKLNIDLLFETSWEVCNKVGGIYTVLSTKALQLKEKFGDRLIFIGPDIHDDKKRSEYFIERKSLLKNISQKQNFPHEIKVRVGRWKIAGSPLAVLIDFKGLYEVKNEIYGDMWQRYGVDSLRAYGDYDESCVFSIAAAIVIERITKHLNVDPKKVISHFNEWTTGMGLLYLKKIQPDSATVFTTHATSIGRSICGNGKPIYDELENYNGDQMASELNMDSKHSLEKKAAFNADCFTTVSDVTARECMHLLEVKPQIVTPNGFEPDVIPAKDKLIELRKKGRKKLLKIASELYNHKTWRDDQTMIIATSGRHEFRNKGIDMFIDSIMNLSDKVKSSKKNYLFYILVPGWVNPASDKQALEISTHLVYNPEQDAIYRILKERKELLSKNVEIVYVPCYLDGRDGVINMSYYSLLPSFDLSVFPSYYEPWGYTPLESIEFGIPTITSDKSGFGQWVASEFKSHLGISIVNRNDSNYLEKANEIAEIIISRSNISSVELTEEKRNLQKIASKADWKLFIKYYFDAFEIALERRNKRI